MKIEIRNTKPTIGRFMLVSLVFSVSVMPFWALADAVESDFETRVSVVSVSTVVVSCLGVLSSSPVTGFRTHLKVGNGNGAASGK